MTYRKRLHLKGRARDHHALKLPTRRRDRYMFPLNTDYDLFSLGPNAQTTVSLGESLGQDDVIRANNGGFFGTASEY